MLRSPASPASIPLRFSLAGGQQLQLADPNGSDPLPPGSAEVVAGAKRVAAIGAATALDAQGQFVPVSYGVEGDRLVMQVDTSGDLAWPLVVDPPIGVYDNNGTSVPSGGTGYYWPNWTQGIDASSTWSYCNNASSNPSKKFYFCKGTLSGASFDGGPLFIKANSTQSYTGSEWAEWIKPARADSYIYQFHAVALSNVANHAKLVLGVWSPAAGSWEQGTVSWPAGSSGVPNPQQAGSSCCAAYYATPAGAQLSADSRYLAVRSGQPGDPISPGNIAALAIGMTAAGLPGSPLPYVAMGGGATFSSETYAPTLDTPTHTTAPPSDWVDSYSDTVSVTATDRGLGMGTVTASGPNLSATSSGCTPNGGPTGAQNLYDSCALNLSLPATSYAAPEGINTYTAAATDLVGNHAQGNDQSWQVKVDNSAPIVGPLSGTLWNARGTQLADGTYSLHIDATDGGTASASTQRSGVQSIEIYVDGNQQDYVEQDCPAGSCAMTRDWTLDTARYGGGQHTVEVRATDQLGHVTTAQSFTFSRPCCMSAASRWGSFTPIVNDVAYADVNGDSFADALARNKLTGDVQVAPGTGSGFGTAQSWGTWSPAYDFHVADVDGDGYGDLVGRNLATGDVSVGLSDGAHFASPVSWGALPTSYNITFADVDSDGRADIVGTDPSTREIVVGYANEGQFDPPGVAGSVDPGYQAQFVDVDGDGAADLVEVNPNTGEVRVGLSDGATFGATTSWGTYGTNATLLFRDVNLDEQADVLVIDKTTGNVEVGYANGIGFDPLTSFGTWDNSYSPQPADIDGDGVGDIVGQNGLTGAIAGATTDASPAPAMPPESFTPDPNVPEGGDVLDETPDGALSAASVKPKKLAFQDQHWLYGAVTPTAIPADPVAANPNAVHILDRLKQAGGSIIRINAIWGDLENRPNTPGSQYNFTQLDAAVHLARQKGFQVELTITGAAAQNDCSGRNPSGIGCAHTATGCYARPSPDPKYQDLADTYVADATNGYSCFTSAYRNLVKEVVNHYTRDAANGNRALNAPGSTDPDRFVSSFAIWNEPNGGGWLAVKGDAGHIPTRLYRRLYQEGYAAYSGVIAAGAAGPDSVKGTQIFIGELASRTRGGAIPGDSGFKHCSRRCLMTAPQFLKYVANDTNDRLLTNGLAYHPYQFHPAPSSANVPRENPGKPEPKWTGMGLLGRVKQTLQDLCDWKADASGKHFCSGGLRTPAPGSAKPPLFLTEFGYLNQPPPRSKDPDLYHTEDIRALWFRGDSQHKGALDLALSGNSPARWLLIYHAVELPPPAPNQFAPWDSGLIKPPPYDGSNNDISGDRHYGRDPQQRKAVFVNRSNFNMKRRAYCAIRTWALKHHYPGVISGC